MFGATPLHLCAVTDQSSVMQRLLHAGVDKNAKGVANREGSRGNTYLFMSSMCAFL